jgi:hypothetical protein
MTSNEIAAAVSAWLKNDEPYDKPHSLCALATRIDAEARAEERDRILFVVSLMCGIGAVSQDALEAALRAIAPLSVDK